MKKLGLLLLMAVLLAGNALASTGTNIYIDHNFGSDLTGDGTINHPWKTLAYTNHHSPQPNNANGNVTWNLAYGNYSQDAFFNPDSAATDTSRFIVIGSTSSPTKESGWLLPSGTLKTSNTSFRGVTFATLVIDNAVGFDSLTSCTIAIYLQLNGTNYIVFNNCTITANDVDVDHSNASNGDTHFNRGTQFLTCSFPKMGTIDCQVPTGCQAHFIVGYGSLTPVVYVDSLVIDHCTGRTTINNVAANKESEAFRFYRCRTPHVIHTTWTIHTDYTGNGEAGYVFALRDSTQNALFIADTLVAEGAGGAEFLWVHTGNLHYIAGTHVDSTYVYTPNGCPLRFQDNVNQFESSYSTFVSGNTNALQGYQVAWNGPNDLQHLTLAGNVPPGGYNWGVVDMHQATFATDTTRFLSNIVYDFSKLNTTETFGSSGSTACALIVGSGTNFAPLFHMDWNLYAAYGRTLDGRFTGGDGNLSLVRMQDYAGSQPGTRNALLTKYPSAQQIFADSINSTYGSPRFGRGSKDSVFATFDPRIGALSVARGLGKSGSDAGAVAYVGNPKIDVSTRQPVQIAYERTATYSVVFYNSGDDTLKVSSVTSPYPTKLTLSASSFNVLAGASYTLTLTWTSPYPYPMNSNVPDASLLVLSNASNNPVVLVALTWSCIDCPFNGNQ